MIRATSQIKIEVVIINKNSKNITLAYSSPLFKPNILQQLDHYAEKEVVSNLVFNNISLERLELEI